MPIVLKPRASSIVTPSTSTAVPTTAGQPLVSTTASVAPKRVLFTKADIEENPEEFVNKIHTFQSEIHAELAALRGFPFVRGVLMKDVECPGVMGQVDTITSDGVVANNTILLWRFWDAPLFRTGYIIRAATADGANRFGGGAMRVGSATVNRDGYLYPRDATPATASYGAVVFNTNLTVSITGFAVGDYLFRSNPRATNTATDTSWARNATITINHGLGVAPRWFWVVSTQRGSRPPELSVLSANENTITLHSTRYAVADVFICA